MRSIAGWLHDVLCYAILSRRVSSRGEAKTDKIGHDTLPCLVTLTVTVTMHQEEGKKNGGLASVYIL